MYQGRPSPDEGGIFDRRDFRYFELNEGKARIRMPEGEVREVDPGYCAKATYVDLAVSEKETADYTVALQVWVTPERDLLITDVIRKRIPGPAQADFLEHNYIGTLKVEAIGYQSALIQALRERGLPVEEVRPDKDKVTRASAAGALYKAGKIYHLQGADWLHNLESELLAFPAGDHDDQVDALAYAARDLPNLSPSQRVWRQKSRGPTIAGGILEMQF
jgi:predicted phage terminase large subunit-like protein